MPASRPLASPEESQELTKAKLAHWASLEEIDQKLTLYDPNGPWRFFAEELRKREDRAKLQLETGPIEDVAVHRAELKLIRDLLDIPNELLRTRALLSEEEIEDE